MAAKTDTNWIGLVGAAAAALITVWKGLGGS